MIVGIEIGCCPHSAVRDDPPLNIGAIEKLQKYEFSPDLILIESAGDNIPLTFSPSLADFFIYMVDVAAGYKRIRKGA